MKNILIKYLYRDAGNYKNYGSVLFHSELSEENISRLKTALLSSLSSEEFVAEDMALPCLRETYDKDLDHSFHEIEEIEIGNSEKDYSKDTYFILEKNLNDCSFEEFVTAFLKKDTTITAWNVYEPSFEEYSGHGFQKPSAKEVKDLLETLEQQQAEALQAI